MPLSELKARSSTGRDRAYKISDERGMHLLVKPDGAKYWRLKYRFAGKEKLLAIGVYPEVTLKEAREKRDEARRMLRDGIDPSDEKQARKRLAKLESTNAFELIAREWIDHRSDKWEAVTRTRILAQFEADVFPVIGVTPIADLKARDVIAVAKAIEVRGAGEMAARVLQRMRSVFRHAVVTERIETNPMLDVKPEEVLRPRQTEHRAALPERDVPEFLSRLDAYNGDPTTKFALQLLILTAVRPGELRGARWEEVDFTTATWRIPAERMKMKAEHIVPLSREAIGVLNAIKPLTANDPLAFPSPFYPGRPISENTLNSALARMGYKGIATAHGFRSLFSTVANEHGHDPDHIERQLAHVERNQTRAAYHRAVYVKERAKLMQWWADWLDAKRQGAEVISLQRRSA